MKNNFNNKSIFFLCFHYLKRNDDYNRIYGYSFEAFKEYINLLINNYSIVGFNDLRNHLNNVQQLPEKSVILSFDDGLAEHAKIIASYLASKNISAVFFPPSCIFNNEMTGTQIIHFITAKYGIRNFYNYLKNNFSVTGLNWEDFFNSQELEKEKNVLDLYFKLKRILFFKMPFGCLTILLRSLYKNILLKDDPDILKKVYFDKNDLKNIVRLGHEIGCHTYSHFSFTQRNLNDNDWQTEIIDSKKILEDLINKKVDIFAYPFGGRKDDFNFDLWTKKLKESGFIYALNANKNRIDGKKLDPIWIERYSVQSNDKYQDIINNAYIYKL